MSLGAGFRVGFRGGGGGFPLESEGKGEGGGEGGGGGVGASKGTDKSMRKLCRNYPLATYPLNQAPQKCINIKNFNRNLTRRTPPPGSP